MSESYPIQLVPAADLKAGMVILRDGSMSGSGRVRLTSVRLETRGVW